MTRRFVALAFLILLFAVPSAAATDSTPPSAADDQSDLCTAVYQLAHIGQCPLQGPGGKAEMIQRYELPARLPTLKILEPEPIQPLTRQYAKVTTSDAPVFAKPEDAAAGIVKRTLGKGFIYVSVGKFVEFNGEEFFKINPDEYMRRSDLSLLTPSDYQGLELAEQPQRPFGWVVRPFQPRLTPDGLANADVPKLSRYDIVQIFGKKHVGEYDWYLVGNRQ